MCKALFTANYYKVGPNRIGLPHIKNMTKLRMATQKLKHDLQKKIKSRLF